MTPDLKPCPFCGCQPNKPVKNNCNRWEVACVNTGCAVLTGLYAYQVVLAWNRRRPVDCSTREIEILPGKWLNEDDIIPLVIETPEEKKE